eukprot:Selendium_serpulae@DN743_c0_g1_i1.p1
MNEEPNQPLCSSRAKTLFRFCSTINLIHFSRRQPIDGPTKGLSVRLSDVTHRITHSVSQTYHKKKLKKDRILDHKKIKMTTKNAPPHHSSATGAGQSLPSPHKPLKPPAVPRVQPVAY